MDDILKGLTLLLGAGVVYVAFQQFRLAREKFKLELFEKRFSVFSGVRRFLSQILSNGNADLKELFEYRASIAEASFLFESDIIDFLNEIDKRALRMHAIGMKLQGVPIGDERNSLADKEAVELTWLTDQLPLLKVKFERYLKFHVWH